MEVHSPDRKIGVPRPNEITSITEDIQHGLKRTVAGTFGIPSEGGNKEVALSTSLVAGIVMFNLGGARSGQDLNYQSTLAGVKQTMHDRAMAARRDRGGILTTCISPFCYHILNRAYVNLCTAFKTGEELSLGGN